MTRFGAAALAVLTIGLAACGGDDGNDAGGGSEPPATDQAGTVAGESGTSSETDAGNGAANDGGDGEGSNETAPSRAEYIHRADQICRRAQLDIARRSGEYRDLTTAFSTGKIEREEYFRLAGDLTERSGEIAQRAVADLKQLLSPTSRRDAIEAYLQGAAKQSDILTAQGRALLQGDNNEVAELNGRMAQASQQTRSAARRVGFRICGGSGS